MTRRLMRPLGTALGTALGLALLLTGLAACGKKGSPSAPGPTSHMTYPRTYPMPD
ncbi:hypothetical protein HLH26_15920 [Gluconacetobacter sp. 1b LMG 1731]|uniref:Lipoprotein n=1 Tax=Gluconacetobacter dulcium TaxID=2729096 RepID=A0A7W4NW37_9PROT|nr:hypothetical protein [Gluconacetobacter dulcium]MBB2165988.1 hypothetical protein [Gluconacetobacter dulcium]MBB2195124.1 hypothetical protein [Gluconacetobacter dulcium]